MCSLLPSSPTGATMPTSRQHSTDPAYVLTQLRFPFFQDPRIPNWLSNFKKKFISTAFTPLLRTLKHRIAPTGLVISRFVSRFVYPPLPAQSSHLFIFYLFFLLIFVSMLPARSLKAISVPNYLNTIGILHKKFNLPNPLLDNWSLQSLLTGIKRVKGMPPAHFGSNLFAPQHAL